jgi:hypothetical protein
MSIYVIFTCKSKPDKLVALTDDHRRTQIQGRPHLGHDVVRRHLEPALGHRAVDLPAVHQAAGRAAHAARAQGRRTGKPIEEPIFGPKQDHLRWSRFKETAPEQMFATVKDEVFPFIKTLGSNGGEEEGDSTYSHHMKDAIFMMPTPRVLANVVDQLDGIDMADSRHQGRPVRVHARQDRQRRAERPVPHAAPHHQADGGDDRPDAEGRDLRPGLRHGRLS